MTGLNRTELVRKIAASTGVTQADTAKVLDELSAELRHFHATGSPTENIVIGSAGRFKVTKRPAGKGRNPRTGEEIDIAASTTLKFKQSSTL